MNQYQAVLLKKLLKVNHIIDSPSNDPRAPSFGVDPRLASHLDFTSRNICFEMDVL